ncbi:MAG: pyruvate, phosphate dikinase, partial [Candidatus Diapherotrites archaeon]
MKRYVYMFEENKSTKESIFLLGNKGAQLAEMSSLGLPVPPGFTITTEACNEFYDLNKKWPEGLERQVKEKLSELEKKMGKKLGDKENPMLVSVRSGSYVSMPGMMDTVLNLGLNDESVKGLAKQTNNERMAYDSYRRFINMFGDVVMGVKHEKFEGILSSVKKAKGAKFDTDLDVEALKEVVEGYKELVKKETGKMFPNDPFEQLRMGINAVFSSWNVPRAVSYRRINKLRNDAGTGVNVQTMVFGNMGEDSGTGVGFTRNPSTGKKEHYGEYLINAQGEDVVAGIRTPEPIDEMKKKLPEAYVELLKIYEKLETHYREMQDFEFTVERGTFFLLQTRSGKRTAMAAVKIAVDMVKEKLISKEEALLRVKPEQLDQLLHKMVDPDEKTEKIAKGLAASPGAAVGKAVFTAEKAKEMVDGNPKERIILVRTETSPEDIEGMHAAQGILTSRGGLTSHAAVVARGMGTPCVAGAGEIHISEKDGQFTAGDVTVKEGDWLTLDGAKGEVYSGELKLV